MAIGPGKKSEAPPPGNSLNGKGQSGLVDSLWSIRFGLLCCCPGKPQQIGNTGDSFPPTYGRYRWTFGGPGLDRFLLKGTISLSGSM